MKTPRERKAWAKYIREYREKNKKIINAQKLMRYWEQRAHILKKQRDNYALRIHAKLVA